MSSWTRQTVFTRPRARAVVPILILASALLLGSYLVQAQDPPPETPPPAAYVGSEMCMGCHEDQARGYTRTIHARVSWEAPEVPEASAPAGASSEPPAAGAGETPAAAETPATEETPAAAETPATEEVPAAAETPATEETPAAAETPGAEEELPAPALAEGMMGCESCHGPGSNHVEAGGGEVGILNPAEAVPLVASGACLKCHESHQGQSDFRFSRHGSSSVACNDCHRVHPKEKKDVFPRMLAKDQPELCYNCHQEQQAQANWPSHHPIREGRTLCSDCHNAHGAGLTKFTDAPNARELCLKCHAQYRGPFATEHSPVADDCTICHKPHGSVEDNLLQASEPSLCMRCHAVVHQRHFNVNVMTPGQVATSTLFFSRCSVCHPQVHGTDMGPRLTR